MEVDNHRDAGFGLDAQREQGKTPLEGHSFCAGGAQPPWGPDVLAFLRETMGGR